MEGFQVPIHRSLTETITIAGVPREMAILNGTITATLVLGLHSFLGLPVGGLVYLGARVVTLYDPQFFAIFRRHIHLKHFYEA